MARGKLSRDIVLDVAAHTINQEGLSTLSIQRLANLLEVKPPSLYNHISSLEDIQNALALRALQQLRTAMAESMVGVSGADAVRKLSLAYLDYAHDNPALYELSQAARQWQLKEIQEAAEAIVSLAKSALAPYGLSEKEEVHAIRTIRSLLHGFATLRISGFAKTVPVDESIDYGIEMIVSSLPR